MIVRSHMGMLVACSRQALLEHEDRLKPMRRWLPGSATTGCEKSVLNDMKTIVKIARVTKLEIISARVLVKSKKDERRQSLISDEVGEVAMDCSKWSIPHPVLNVMVWAPLWKLIEKYSVKASSVAAEDKSAT